MLSHLASLYIIEPLDEGHNGGLPAARLADQGHHLASWHAEAEVAQHWLVKGAWVGKGDALQHQRALAHYWSCCRAAGSSSVQGGWLPMDDCKHSVARCLTYRAAAEAWMPRSDMMTWHRQVSS